MLLEVVMKQRRGNRAKSFLTTGESDKSTAISQYADKRNPQRSETGLGGGGRQR